MTKVKRPEFRPNDFVAYPAHGVGRIISIEEQEVAGTRLELFVISFEKDKLSDKGIELFRELVGMKILNISVS